VHFVFFYQESLLVLSEFCGVFFSGSAGFDLITLDKFVGSLELTVFSKFVESFF